MDFVEAIRSAEAIATGHVIEFEHRLVARDDAALLRAELVSFAALGLLARAQARGSLRKYTTDGLAAIWTESRR